MTKEAITAELLAIRDRAEQTVQNVEQISRDLYKEQKALRQVVDEYGAKRIELLKEEFNARGLTWCTYCSKVVSESETELILVEGKRKYSHGYGNCYYGFEDFSKLHRACPACRERAADRHGQKGEYDSYAKDQTSFYAFRVEKRDDGCYARKFGDWVKLDDENCKLAEPPFQLVEKLAEEWHLPPQIGLDHHDFKLIIH